MPTPEGSPDSNGLIAKSLSWITWAIVFGVLVVLLLGMRWGRGIGWDEAEFFRATDWVRMGKIPFRDFWEHHFPLQWILMAPAAALVKEGYGTTPLIWMRFSQLPFWVMGTWALWRLSRHLGAPVWLAGVSLAWLWSSLSFAPYALEYRQDTLSTCFYLLAILLLEVGEPSRLDLGAWAGALLGCAVAANLRMAPPVLLTLALYLFGGTGSRYGWIRLSGLCAVGAFVLVAALGGVGLWVFNAWKPFWIETVVQNRLANGAAMARLSIWRYLLIPIENQDLPTIVLFAGMGWALTKSIRSIRAWASSQRLAVLILFQAVTLSLIKATYTYHLQVTLTLGIVLLAGEAGKALASHAKGKEIWWRASACLGLAYACFNLTVLYDWRAQKNILSYQSEVLASLAQRVRPTQQVLDGCGYAYRNEPAFPFWFLPVHVRVLTAEGKWPAYTSSMMEAEPPAAVLLTGRVSAYLMAFPDLGNYFIHHYVPIYNNLWVPGLAGALTPSRRMESWVVPVAGTYRLVDSRALMKHPLFQINPLYFGIENGPLPKVPVIDLNQLQKETPIVSWSINGQRVNPNDKIISLNVGDRVQATADGAEWVALLAVPSREQWLFHSGQSSVGFDPELDSISKPLLFD